MTYHAWRLRQAPPLAPTRWRHWLTHALFVGGIGLIIVLFLFGLSACSSLILRPDDHAAVKTGKVLTRVPLGLATLGMSEVGIHAAKIKESCNEERWVMEVCGNPVPVQQTTSGVNPGVALWMMLQAGQPDLAELQRRQQFTDTTNAFMQSMGQAQTPYGAPSKTCSTTPWGGGRYSTSCY